jgi:Tannase and feruloyl esterase
MRRGRRCPSACFSGAGFTFKSATRPSQRRCDQFHLISAVTDWVEKGKAPDSVVATGKAFPGRSRPLCAYPK